MAWTGETFFRFFLSFEVKRKEREMMKFIRMLLMKGILDRLSTPNFSILE